MRYQKYYNRPPMVDSCLQKMCVFVFVCVCVCVITEAADACQLRRCKYAEVSATLGHRVDELLVGIAKQIRLRVRSSGHRPSAGDVLAAAAAGLVDDARHQGGSPSLWSTAGRLKSATKFLVRGLFGRPPTSCSDLMKP